MPTIMSLTRLLDQIATDLRLSEPQLAGALGVTPRTLERWRTGTRYPQHDSRRRLETLTRLHERLQASFSTSGAMTNWVHADSGYLRGLKPVDALQVGRIDAVDAALEALDSGIFV
ncbi:MAG: hypothetical protein M3464_13705 [Chloroflexota bacterium]|nr:hypothetical protein [Chloroflexota bacterium]